MFLFTFVWMNITHARAVQPAAHMWPASWFQVAWRAGKICAICVKDEIKEKKLGLRQYQHRFSCIDALSLKILNP